MPMSAPSSAELTDPQIHAAAATAGYGTDSHQIRGPCPSQGRQLRAASQAKLYATEAAWRIIDEAVQIHGGQGLVRGHPVERLYRDVRALRIYEGTSEIQKLIIAREMRKE